MSDLPGIGVITLDAELRVRSWNDWLVAATGITSAVAEGRAVTELIPPSRVDVIGEDLAAVLQTGISRVLAPALHHFFVLCPPPQPNAFFREMQQRVVLAPLQDDARIVGILITIEDVTMRMVHEREQALLPSDAVDDAVTRSGAADWRVRAEATRSLKRLATAAEIAQLLEALQRDHNDFSVLSGALQVLVAVDGGITTPLITLLSDPSANVRMHAALALGALGDREGVPGLLGALHDADSNVRFHAIEALGRLAAPEAVGGLQEVAASGDFFLAFPAIDALARIDDPAVVPALMALLDQDDLRPAIVDALAALGDEECVGVLATLLNNGREDVSAVAAALLRIGQRYELTFGTAGVIVDAFRGAIAGAGVERLSAAVLAGQAGLSEPVIVVLGWVGDPAISALVSVVGQSPFQHTVTQALVNIGSPAVPALVAQLRDGVRDARVASAFLLGSIGDAGGAPALVEALRSHDNELVGTAARALAAIGEGGPLDSLLALFAHPDVMVRQAAIAAVNALGPAGTEARLLRLLDDPDAHVRECAVRSAGYFAFETCADGLLRAVHDEVEGVRRAAIEQLPLVEHAESLDRLLTALARETPRNRATAAHALRLVDAAPATAALLDALGDDDPWVRYFAVGSLAQRASAAAVDVLEAMALVDAAPHVRIAALRALGVLDAGVLLRVASRAAADADEDVAAAAIRALSPAAGHDAELLLEQAMLAGRETVRIAAADALGNFPTMASVQTLAWAARLKDSPTLAATAMDSLGRMASLAPEGVAIAVPALIELGIDAEWRERVVQLLGALPPAAAPEVARQLASPRASVRVVTVEGLARMRHAAATAHVATALADPDSAVRAAAVMAFGRLGSSGVAHTVASMSEADPDAGVRRRARAVCRRYGWTLPGRHSGTR